MTEKTLRDEIAISALQGILANPSGTIKDKLYGGGGVTASEAAYLFADAMLTQRGKG